LEGGRPVRVVVCCLSPIAVETGVDVEHDIHAVFPLRRHRCLAAVHRFLSWKTVGAF